MINHNEWSFAFKEETKIKIKCTNETIITNLVDTKYEQLFETKYKYNQNTQGEFAAGRRDLKAIEIKHKKKNKQIRNW